MKIPRRMIPLLVLVMMTPDHLLCGPGHRPAGRNGSVILRCLLLLLKKEKSDNDDRELGHLEGPKRPIIVHDDLTNFGTDELAGWKRRSSRPPLTARRGDRGCWTACG